ncbi:MAG: ABC transporter permease [Eubacteriales bacterium]|nr:ABC transporter permease [Eubacteriales bacterium]
MDLLISIIQATLIYGTPITIAAIGGLFSERSGVVNIALEGIMMIGGFTSATVLYFLADQTSLAPWIAILCGAGAGVLISVLHAYLSINLRADQTISGTAINIFAGGITVYMAGIIFNQQRTEQFSKSFSRAPIPGLSKIPFLGDLLFNNIYPTVYLSIIIVVAAWYLLYKTSFGLRLRATGENPHAVDSLGISVYKMRYIGVLASGLLAGLAGGIMILTQDTQYTITGIHGTGFIALAALIFGKWKPLGVLASSLFFAFAQILSIYAGSLAGALGMPFLGQLPKEFYDAIPYLMTIVALILFSGRSVGPKAAGEPYDKGKR